MKDIWGSGIIGPPFLNLALDGGEFSASRSRHFNPEEIGRGTHRIRSWVSISNGMNSVENKKILHCLE
jgi:hypothetical protein